MTKSRLFLGSALLFTAVSGCDCDADPVVEIDCDFEVEALGGTEIDFGTVVANEGRREATFVVNNTGNQPLNQFSFTFSGNGEHYDVEDADGFKVAPSDDEALIVSFEPTRVSVLPATLTISHTDLGANGCPVRSITLTGEGILAPVVDAGVDAGPEDGGFFVDSGVLDAGFVDDPDGGVILPPNAAWRAYGGFEEARAGFASVELLSGELLAIGGWGENGTVLDSIEKFDPATGRSRIVARMAQPRAEPGAVMIGDGRIAIVGGRTAATQGVVNTTVELFNPSDDTLSCPGTQADDDDACADNALGFLQNARINPVVTSLGNAVIAVAGGRALDDAGAEVAFGNGDTIDVNSGVVTPITNLDARLDEARVVGPDGSFLLVGGRNFAGVPDGDIVRFDGGTRAVSVVGVLPAARAAAGAVALENGDVFVSGGTAGNGAVLRDAVVVRDAFTADDLVADPLTLTLDPRVAPSIVVLPGDFLLIAGGLPSQVFGKDDDDSVAPLTSGEVLVPFGATFARLSPANDLAQGRVGGVAVVTGPSGDDVVTFVGGYAVQPRRQPQPHGEQYRVVTNEFASFGLMGPGTALAAAAISDVSVAALVSVGGVDPHTQATSSRVRFFAAADDEGFFGDATPLRSARRDHSATSIAADLIVVIGGRDENGTVLGSISILDVDGSDQPLPVTLRRPRAQHTATLLPADVLGENVILVCGGVGAGGETLDTCELVTAPDNPRNPATFDSATVVLVGNRMSAPRVAHTATLFDNGEVLLLGGGDIESDQAAADLFVPDPVDSHLVATGVPVHARRDHAAVALGGGRVLVVGGDVFEGGVGPTRTAELYNRASESFVAVDEMEQARSKPAAFLLADGQVLVSGGTQPLGAPGFPNRSVVESELYNGGATGIGDFTFIDVPLSYGRSDLAQFDVLGRAVVVGGTHRDGIVESGDERRTPQHFIDKLEEAAP